MSAHNPGRPAYILAALLLCAYAVNVLIGKSVASFGWQLPRGGDVAEFLAVLAAMVLFVTGLMRNEAAATPPNNSSPYHSNNHHPRGEDNDQAN